MMSTLVIVRILIIIIIIIPDAPLSQEIYKTNNPIML